MAHKSFFLAIALIGFSSIPAFAQVYNCNGVWTSKQCDQPSLIIDQTKDKDNNSSVDLDSQKLKREKLSLIYHLKNFARTFDNLKQETPPEIDATEDFCVSEQTSLEDCRTRVNDVEHSIEQRENEKLKIKIEKERLELEKAKSNQPTTQIAVTNETNYIRVNPGIYDCNGTWQTRPCVLPKPKPIMPPPQIKEENKGNSIRLRQHKPTRKHY